MLNQKEIDLQEEKLKTRLENLEKKYRGSLFSNDYLSHLENEVKLDLKNKEEKKIREIEIKPIEIEKIKPEKIKKIKPIKIKSVYIPKIEPLIIEKKSPSTYAEDYKEERQSKSYIEAVRKSAEKISRLKKEIAKVIVGQDTVVDGLIKGLICNGHVLLEGIPGIAKTLTIRALGQASGCSVKRIQFTVDLLPTDITGITAYTPEKGFEIIKGPVFANFLIADEINRSPPKTQSALIEAMQEKQVTIGKETFPLPNPFFVMATKNPIESTGVYQLPEAQIDRFLFNIFMGYPKKDEERRIMAENINLKSFDEFNLKPVISPDDILEMQELVKDIYLGEHIKSYILSIVEKTRDKNFEYADCISYGASPRASIALFIASKANAFMKGRSYVLPEDVRDVAFDVLRHRVILSYKATIRSIGSENIIKTILEEVRV